MKTVNLQQGSQEWLQWRAAHFTASDAPAMLGISPYRTRESLLREKATGERVETNQATERIFAEGHKFEALARPLAEEFIGEELFPLVCESGKLAASLDGATLDGGILWEHKTMNDAFRACRDNGAPIPEYIRAQVEHQMLVTGANRCLVTASVWQGNELAEPPFHGWIEPDNALRRRIIDGWAQFEKDVSEWKPTAEKPEGQAPEMLPALRVEVRGQVVASNLADFRAHAMAVIGSINTNLKTDEDFANAEKTVKWCKEVETRISGAKQNALAQTGDIDALFRALDEVSEFARKTRLNLEKQVKAEKDSIRAGRIRAADASFTAYCHGLMQENGFQINMPIGIDFAAVIHGLKTLSSIDEKLGAALAREKSVFAARMDDAAAKLEWMRTETNAAQWSSLFDRDMLALLDLSAEAFRDAVTGRIAKAQAEQAAREDAQRQAAEARARAQAEAQAQAEQRVQQARLILHALENKDWNMANSLLALTGLLAMLSSRSEFVHWQAPELRLRMNQNDRFLAEGILPREFESLLADRIGQPVRLCIEFPAQQEAKQETAQPQGTPVALKDINAAIAPLSITTAGMEHFGLQRLDSTGRSAMYPAGTISLFCRIVAQHLQNVAKEHEV